MRCRFVTRGAECRSTEQNCINIINLSDVERSRLITAEWEDNDLEEGGQYLAELKIFADDRRGLLLDITKSIYGRKDRCKVHEYENE